MFQIIIIFHVIIACCLVAVVLMQHGKGANAGVSLGSSASGSVFGSVGALPFMVKLTSLLAASFFATSLLIGYFTVHAQPVSKGLDSLLHQTAPPALVKPLAAVNAKSEKK